MDASKLDLAIAVLEGMRTLHQQMEEVNTPEALRSREYSLAITNLEQAKLWMQEVVVKVQNAPIA